MLICQENYFNNNSSKNDILFYLKKYAFFTYDESLQVYNDIIKLNKIHLKNYYYFLYFNNNQNKYNDLNHFMNIGYTPLNQ